MSAERYELYRASDQVDAAERREIIRRDRDLERMIRGVNACLVPGSRAYRNELVAIVRRHNAELVAALAKRDALIDHLEQLLWNAAAQGRDNA